jgi:hypothetical protein
VAPDPVFDQPDEIGPLRWSDGWLEEDDLVGRLLTTLAATIAVGGGGTYAIARLAGHASSDRITPMYAIPMVLIGIVAYFVFAPDRHCMCVGERGISITHRRFGFFTKREVLLFDEVDDVEIESTRIVSDAVSQIYMRTDLTFSWIDREGYEVFTSTGTIDEPAQRATPKYDPTAPVDLDGSRDRGTNFGYAAMEAFRLFKDQRPVVPYR